MQTAIPKLSVKIYRFHFDVTGPIKLPKYAGSAWRGAFGHALKKTVCVVRNTACNDCLLKSACAYTYLFETQPPLNTEKLRKYNAIPHPFVLQLPQEEVIDAATYLLDVVLFGHGQRYLPYIIHALQKAGHDGIGAQRQVFNLDKVEEIDLDGTPATVYQSGELKPQSIGNIVTIPEMPAQITINFQTPLRIKQDGKNITPSEFSFAVLFSTLLRRISLISYFHTDTPLELDFASLSQAAKTVKLKDKKLEWYDWTRYSSRQDTEMQMGGVIGWVKLTMHGLEAFWPYLWLGQWTHAGKGTSMGMGSYKIQITSLPDKRDI